MEAWAGPALSEGACIKCTNILVRLSQCGQRACRKINMRARVAGFCAVVIFPYDIPAVFAGLPIMIVENLIFRTIKRNTVQKWGTQS